MVKWDGILHTESLGAYLKSLRQRAGLSAEAIKAKTGMSCCTVSRVEKNDCISDETLRKLMDIFSISDKERETLYGLIPEKYKDTIWDGKIYTDNFGAYLKSLRLRKCLSQAELSRMAGYDSNNVCKAESNRKITDAYMVFADILCETEEEKKLYSELLKRAASTPKKEVQPPENDDFGPYLRYLRQNRNISGHALGKMIGTTGAYIYAVEEGKYGMTKQLNEVADILNLSLSERQEFARKHETQWGGLSKQNNVILDGSSGEYLKSLRKRAGLTQGELADRADISISTIFCIENNRVCGHTTTLRCIADALGLSDTEKRKLLGLAESRNLWRKRNGRKNQSRNN